MASAAPPEFLGAFRHAAGDGTISFARFMELALYHPDTGYYARRRRRIGRTAETDFFTATSLGPVFGELVAEACAALLNQRPPRDHTFVEIGAESPAPGNVEGVESSTEESGGVLALAGLGPAGVAHPFAAVEAVMLNQPLRIPARAVVFSNELFDAQPCHRLIRHAGRWRESGVGLRQEALEEVLLPDLTPEVQAVLARLPAVAPDGYRIDLPLAAASLAARIAALPWTGLFVAFDYGKSWRELAEDTPAGTVRAYFRHRQSNDLLAHPGEQDLTCHVCWDWLGAALTAQGFTAPVLESQEAFFVHHASAALSRLTADEAGRFSRRKLGVMQLLHPGNLGQKFQVLWARREQAT